MKLSVEDALTTGFERIRQRNGLLLVGVVYALALLESVVGPAEPLTIAVPGAEDVVVAPAAPVGVPLVVDSLVSLLVAVGGLLTTIAALRVFASGETERLSREAFTRNGVWAVANVFVGAIVFVVLVTLGFVALVLPGLYLLAALFLWTVPVAVEDENFGEGLRTSWRLTSGHRFKTFLLGVAFVVATIVVNVVAAIVGAILGPVGFLVTALGSAVVTVFGHGTVVAAYQQLSRGEAAVEA